MARCGSLVPLAPNATLINNYWSVDAEHLHTSRCASWRDTWCWLTNESSSARAKRNARTLATLKQPDLNCHVTLVQTAESSWDCPITGRGDESSHVSGIHAFRDFFHLVRFFFFPRRRKEPLKTDNEATSRVEKKGNSLYDVYARCSIISNTKLVNRRDLRTPIRFMRLHNVARRDSEIAHPGGAFAFNEQRTVYEARVLSSRAGNISLPLILLMLRSSAMMNARLKITNGIKIEVACGSSSSLHFSTILIMHVAIIISMKMSVLIKASSMGAARLHDIYANSGTCASHAATGKLCGKT